MKKISIGPNFLIIAASFVIVIAGMKAAQQLLVPFLLSLFIAIICTPFLTWLRKKKVPNVLAVLLILLGIVIIGLLLTAFVGSSLNDFSKNLPEYQTSLAIKTASFFSWLKEIGLNIPAAKLSTSFDPGAAMKIAASTLAGIGEMLSSAFIILLTVIFILMEAAGFPSKLCAALDTPEKSLARLNKITQSINRYLAIKTMFCLLTGVAVTIWLWILGVDYPLLWGLFAFLLNYIPNIGSIIAAIPAILLALIQLGLGHALMATLGYVVINVLVGNILEPKFMGKGLGLSTLIVFLSLIFWGWVLGPVGMILSVPLTVIIKIAMESDEDKHWIAILMG